MRESIYGGPMAGPSPFGFAAHAPQTGFAAALREGARQQEAGEEHRPITKKPTLSNETSLDKEHSRHTQTAKSARRTLQMTPGRQIDASKKGMKWKGFQAELQHRNGGLFDIVYYRKLMVKYVSDELMAELLDARLGEKPHARSGENQAVRDLISKMNQFCTEQGLADSRREAKLLAAYPNLASIVMERQLDPDNLKWFAEDPHPEFPVKRDEYGFAVLDSSGNPTYDFSNWIPRNEISAWSGAQFEIAKQSSSAPTKVSVLLEDRSGVLHRGREQFVDAMASRWGFEVTKVPVEWQPEVDIMQTIGGRRSIDEVRFSIPEMPPVIPLKPGHVYES